MKNDQKEYFDISDFPLAHLALTQALKHVDAFNKREKNKFYAMLICFDEGGFSKSRDFRNVNFKKIPVSSVARIVLRYKSSLMMAKTFYMKNHVFFKVVTRKSTVDLQVKEYLEDDEILSLAAHAVYTFNACESYY